MPWNEQYIPDPAVFERMVGRTIAKVVVEPDVGPDDPDADVVALHFGFDDGSWVMFGDRIDTISGVKVGGEPPINDDPPSFVFEREETYGPDSPLGVPGCTCVDEPGEDPLCKVHGTPQPDA